MKRREFVVGTGMLIGATCVPSKSGSEYSMGAAAMAARAHDVRVDDAAAIKQSVRKRLADGASTLNQDRTASCVIPAIGDAASRMLIHLPHNQACNK